ncbi:MAG TPA: MFS transporter [Candidatus Krumholzibacteria bacterium]|nr:MFS transporter [Candidatus Krumholzibacteria bacterium]HRX51166.1 MFS transporter [Candidatus Krumholzibacteria bacterium]
MVHAASRSYRFTVLLFASLLTFGSYFAYDIIGALAPSLVDDLGAGRGTIGSFYTAYSVAAILAVFGGGFLIDRLGTRRSSMLFSLLVLAGAVVVASAKSIPMVMAGRFLFGAGAEPLVVAQSAILARWFKNKEMALAFGLALTVSRLGTLFAFNTGELIAEIYGGYHAGLWAAVLFCGISLAGNAVYVVLDRKGERELPDLQESGSEDKITFGDIAKLKPSFWYVTMLCVLFYSAVFPFTALSTDFFVDKWGVARVAETSGGFLTRVFSSFLHMFETAGGLSSIIIFASMIFAPFAGHLVDRVGKRATLMVWGSLLMIPAYLLLGLTDLYPVGPLILLGAAFVLVPAAMWPAIPLVVKDEHTGTAFGLCTAVQNIGLALFPWLNGLLRDATEDYTASMLMFAGLGVLGVVFAVLLKRSDRDVGGALERGSA